MVNINHTGPEPFEYFISNPNTENVKKILNPEKRFSRGYVYINSCLRVYLT